MSRKRDATSRKLRFTIWVLPHVWHTAACGFRMVLQFLQTAKKCPFFSLACGFFTIFCYSVRRNTVAHRDYATDDLAVGMTTRL